jgi:hypothetical protein
VLETTVQKAGQREEFRRVTKESETRRVHEFRESGEEREEFGAVLPESFHRDAKEPADAISIFEDDTDARFERARVEE